MFKIFAKGNLIICLWHLSVPEFHYYPKGHHRMEKQQGRLAWREPLGHPVCGCPLVRVPILHVHQSTALGMEMQFGKRHCPAVLETVVRVM